MAFKRGGFWIKRSKGEIVAIVKAGGMYEDSYYDWKTGRFKPCPNSVMELGMSDDWDKVPEEQVLKELGKKHW